MECISTDPHAWPLARRVALAEAGYVCADCGASDWEALLEVHHVVPVAADGYGPGCQHHQSNLRVLCRPHHRAIHAAMRARPGEQLRLTLAA